MASLPGNPWADLFVKLDKDDVAGLIDNGYLRKLTSFFIQHVHTQVNHKLLPWRHYNKAVVGMNATAFQRSKKQQKFEILCGQLAGFDTGKHQIIVPDIAQSHYSVIDIMIDNEYLKYIMEVFHYDSLECVPKLDLLL